MLHEPDGLTVGPLPSLDDLPILVERFGADGQIDIRLVQNLGAVAVPRPIAAMAYRVVVEALTNVRRHSPGATRVDVSVAANATGVEVQVHNDAADSPGPSRRRSEPGGRGLQGLRTLIAASGGTLSAGRCGRDWKVVAVIPGRTT